MNLLSSAQSLIVFLKDAPFKLYLGLEIELTFIKTRKLWIILTP